MRMLWWLRILFVSVVLFSSQTAQAWRWGRWQLRLRVDLASGVDDNVRRIALPPTPEGMPTWERLPTLEPIYSRLPPISIETDGFHQVGSQLQLLYRDARHIWLTSYGLGFKHFFLTSDEDVFSQQGQTTYYIRLHPRVLLGVQAQVADMRRINQSREFSDVRGQFLFQWLAPLDFHLSLSGGYGLFDYRHFELFDEAYSGGFSDGQRFSFHGDSYQIQLAKRFTRVFRTYLSYQFSRQFYQVKRLRDDQKTCTVSSRELRGDLQHRAAIGMRVLYFVLIDASYQFEANDADSCGESYLGHRVSLRLAATPFWQLFVSIEVQLQFRTFVDGTPFNPSLPTTQDDNLTSFTVRLSRPILPYLHLNFRYSHFANFLGLGINQFARNLFSLGISLQF